MSVEQLTTSLRAAIASSNDSDGNGTSHSPTVLRVCAAFQLLESLTTLPVVALNEKYKLAQRVVHASTGESGSIREWHAESDTYTLVMDSGSTLHSVSASDMTEFAEGTDNNQRLDFVSRIVWVNALSENRIPMNGVHLDPELGSWAIFEQAFQLTTPWTANLWTARPTLVALNFEWWLYLFAESARTKLKGADYLALLMMEEAYKHVAAVEERYLASPRDDLVASFLEGVAELTTYCPQAVHALGTASAGAGSAAADSGSALNGSFSLLRHIVSTQALKVIRTVYRKPKTEQYDIDRQLLLQRYKFYLDLQRMSEDELRARNCASLFGDGQSHWNAGWLYSLNTSDPKTVCCYLRQGMTYADAENNNDFVAAKARWDLAGSIMLGGEGDSYDIREISTLRDEAEKYESSIATLGMKFYVQGESLFAKFVLGQLQQFTGKGPFIRQIAKVQKSTYSDKGLPACHYCQKGTEGLKACGSCKRIRYCSRECQKNDFKVHKKVCKKFQQK